MLCGGCVQCGSACLVRKQCQATHCQPFCYLLSRGWSVTCCTPESALGLQSVHAAFLISQLATGIRPTGCRVQGHPIVLPFPCKACVCITAGVIHQRHRPGRQCGSESGDHCWRHLRLHCHSQHPGMPLHWNGCFLFRRCARAPRKRVRCTVESSPLVFN